MFSWIPKTAVRHLQKPVRCALILPICNSQGTSQRSAFHTQQSVHDKAVPRERKRRSLRAIKQEKTILDTLFGPVVSKKNKEKETESKLDKNDTGEGASPSQNSTEKHPASSVDLGLPPDLQYMLTRKQRSNKAVKKLKETLEVNNSSATTAGKSTNEECSDSTSEHVTSTEVPSSMSTQDTTALITPHFPMTNMSAQQEPPVPETPMTLKPDRRVVMETGHTYPDLGMPSVGSILRKTMPAESVLLLERWKARMISELGEEGFKKLQEDTFREGQTIHTAIDALLTGTPEGDLTIPEENQGHWASIQHVLADISDVCVVESVVKHPELQYGGILDCVAKYRGQWCLVDWKTSKRLKPTLKQCYDIPLQVAAYTGALNYDNNYGFQVEKALVVVAYGNGDKGHAHLLPPALTEHYWRQWLKRLHEFNMKFRHT